MSDSASIMTIILTCCVPLLCLVLVGAGVIFWIISRKIAKEERPRAVVPTSEPAKAPVDEPAKAPTNTPKKTQSATPKTFPQGSVGAVSQQVGYDVRDLMMMGFTQSEISYFSKEEIMSVVNGKKTLQQLRKEKEFSGK